VELNILILPLIGGYRFYTKFNWTAYEAARCTNQRLLFNSALIGLVFLVSARFLEKFVTFLSNRALEFSGTVGIVAAATALLACIAMGLMAWEAFRGDAPVKSKQSILGAAITAIVALYLTFQTIALPGDILCNLSLIVSCMAIMALPVAYAAHALSPSVFIPFHKVVFRLSILILLATLLTEVCIGHAGEIARYWHSFSPYNESGAAALACAVGVFLAAPLNSLLFGYQPAIHRLYLNLKINAFEREMFDSMTEESQIQITLEDGKVYTGWATNVLPNLSETDTYFRILPVWSGYRDEKKKIIKTTFYDNVYQHFVQQAEAGEKTVDIDSFIKIIPISKIILAGKFNDEAAGKFIDQPLTDPAVPLESMELGG
jgi:hypothetical protein